MNSSHQFAVIGIRLIALAGLFGSLWMLIGNLAEFSGEVDWIYLGFFIRACLLKPLAGCVLACLLWFASSRMGDWLVGDLDQTK